MLSKDLKNKDTILAALTSLGSDDLKAIKAAAGALLGEKGTVGSPYDRTGYEPWLREAIKAITGQGIRDNDRVFNKNAVGNLYKRKKASRVNNSTMKRNPYRPL